MRRPVAAGSVESRRSQLSLLVDFGSTFTKIALVDAKGDLLGVGQAPTTVEGVMTGLHDAVGTLSRRIDLHELRVLASSSAAGGLRIAAIGLVPELTAQAARTAALGAGAKVERVFSHDLDSEDVNELERLAPDMVLLAGGTDGGNRRTIVANAARLAESRLDVPIVMAGNRSARTEVTAILTKAGKSVVVTENVLAQIEHLNIEPARQAIRELFMSRITKAKGMEITERVIGNVVMPTPMAVLEAAELMAGGTEELEGFGPTMIVDVGGATTDVHSVAPHEPAEPGWLLKGLEEPFAKRTVEGDLGIRINARSIESLVDAERICAMAPAGVRFTPADVEARVESGALRPAHLPAGELESAVDSALARAAVDVAVERHAGRVELVYSAQGKLLVQYGKSLAKCTTVIGTGGVLVRGAFPGNVLGGVAGAVGDPYSLRPRNAELYVDRYYVLYAAGLLKNENPTAALRLLKQHLVRIAS